MGRHDGSWYADDDGLVIGRSDAGRLVLVLALGLALRGFIAWIWLPESGFILDLDQNAGWVRVLQSQEWADFYRPDADYFIDYPPAYFYLLSAVGWLQSAGLAADPDAMYGLLKLAPILADIAGAALLALLAARALGAWAAVPAAAIYLFNPAVVFDSAVYGQNDSVGTLVVIAGLYFLVRGWTEAAAASAVLATLVKFQFGFLIPIVLVVGLRRHLGLAGTRIRVLSSLASAIATLWLVVAPFQLALFNPADPARSLWHRFMAAAAAFPGVTQNAFNLWMNPISDVMHVGPDGLTQGSIVDDTQGLFTVGPVTINWQLLGTLLFVLALVAGIRVLAHRIDPIAIIFVALVLAVALYVFPTRVHERYLMPALAIGVPLAMLRRPSWQLCYGALSAVAFFAIYFVYTLPNLNRHLPRDEFLGATVLTPLGIYALSAVAVACMLWLLWQALRPERLPGHPG